MFLLNNQCFGILYGQNYASFDARQRDLFLVFLSSLVLGKIAFLQFYALRDKKKRDNASISTGKQIHLSSFREQPEPALTGCVISCQRLLKVINMFRAAWGVYEPR